MSSETESVQPEGAWPAIRFGPPRYVNAGFPGEVKVGRRLRDLGVPALHGAFIGDDPKRERELDYLALLGDRIWIVEVKSSEGHPPRWTADGVRLVGPATLDMARRQIRRQVQALAALLPGTDVAGVIVFSARVRVVPPCDGAITLEDLPDFVAREGAGQTSAPTLKLWERLRRLRAACLD